MEVQRLLVDDGSSCDIIFLEAFMKIRIKANALKECVGGLVGFTGHEAPIVGILTLPMNLGEWPRATTEMIDFLVMDLPSAYNGIFGRTSLSAMGIVTSVRHQLIKFPTPNGIGQVRGNHPAPRGFYYTSKKNSINPPSIKITDKKGGTSTKKSITASLLKLSYLKFIFFDF